MSVRSHAQKFLDVKTDCVCVCVRVFECCVSSCRVQLFARVKLLSVDQHDEHDGEQLVGEHTHTHSSHIRDILGEIDISPCAKRYAEIL